MTKTIEANSLRTLILSALLIAFLALQGCSPGDRLESLVAKGKFLQAASVYNEQKEYFQENEAKHKKHLNMIAQHLNTLYEPELKSSISELNGISWPRPESEWSTTKGQIAKASQLIEEYDKHDILTKESFMSPLRMQVHSLLTEKEADIGKQAENAFVNYNHFTDTFFFDAYPVAIEPNVLIADHFEQVYAMLESTDPQRIAKFVRLYEIEKIVSKENFTKLSNLYLSVSLREKARRTPPDFETIMDAVQAAEEAGFIPSQIPNVKIGFAKIESKDLTANGLREYSVQFEPDMPFEFLQIDLAQTSLKDVAQRFDYLVIFHILEATNTREIANLEKVASTFQSGSITVPNPDYQAAQIEVNRCQNDLNQAQNSSNLSQAYAQASTGYDALGHAISSLGYSMEVGEYRTKLNEAIYRLQQTPAYIEKPVYQDYEFNRVEIEAKKTLNTKYYVFNRAQNSSLSGSISYFKKDSFTVLYNLKDSDPGKATFLGGTVAESELEQWEKIPIVVNASNVVNHYRRNLSDPKRQESNSLVTIQNRLLEDEKLLTTNLNASRITSVDPRFDSVVVLASPDGKFGSGFFVKPDVVLTNYHIVEGVKYIEMKTYADQETSGKVISSNIRLDLALIRVQTRGKPVRFYDGTGIVPGDTVEAVGHPNGLEFSITRGVLSAIRRIPSSYAPGADDVLVIQTDAAINPGNSGGPLFLKDEVIGVNSQKAAKVGIEGLGFAIHYKEVLSFINGSLAGLDSVAESGKPEEVTSGPRPQKPGLNTSGRKGRGYKLKRAASGEIAKDKDGNFIFVPVYEDEEQK